MMKKFIFNLTHWSYGWDEYQKELAKFRAGYDFDKEKRRFNDWVKKRYPKIVQRGYTDKEVLSPFFFAPSLKGKRQKVVSTSGTSSVRGFYFWSDCDTLASRQALWDYRFEQIGFQKGKDKRLKIWYPLLGHKLWQRLKLKLKRKLEKEFFLSYFGILERDLGKGVEFIKKVQPQLIEGYSRAMVLIAEYILKNKIKIDGVKWIVTSAGPTTKAEREMITSAFGAKVYDRYGCSEFGEIAHQLPTSGEAYEINPALELYGLKEGDDYKNMKKLEKLPDGDYSLFVTDCRNYSTPFWRYEMRDIITVKNGKIVGVKSKTGVVATAVLGKLKKIYKVKIL